MDFGNSQDAKTPAVPENTTQNLTCNYTAHVRAYTHSKNTCMLSVLKHTSTLILRTLSWDIYSCNIQTGARVPLILDSCCGTGRSTLRLAARNPGAQRSTNHMRMTLPTRRAAYGRSSCLGQVFCSCLGQVFCSCLGQVFCVTVAYSCRDLEG